MKKNKSAGFTIIESLVAIGILVVAISGVMGAIQSSISSYTFSKDQFISFYLAQEAFEQIRNIRDENRLKEANWMMGIAQDVDDPCAFTHACTVEPVISAAPSRCTGGPGNCPYLRQDPVTGLYGYNPSWPATIFRREIQLTPVNENEIAVTVTVNWSKGPVNRQFKARANLLNW